jgi:PAS domain S-box-containing protein
MGFFQQLFSSDFMPHGFCYLWDPRIVWLHVISDGLIALSYYCIPIILIYFIFKHRDRPFNRVFWMFGAFILACGTTHVMEIWNVWQHGSYVLAGVVKAITAVVSVVTVAMLLPLIPKVISLPERLHLQEANLELEHEIAERKRAEQALKESLAARESAVKELAEQKFALDQHAIVAVTDLQGTITYVNDRFSAINLYSREEAIGRNYRIVNSGYHPKEFFQKMYDTLGKGRVWHGEIRNRAKDGSIFWVAATTVPLLDSGGKPRQYITIRTDITARKRLEEVREHLAAVVESSDDAIISKTLNGMVTAWNSGAERLFGYSSAESVGKPMDRLLPLERATEESDILARIARGERVDHFETVRVRKDGKRVDISATISPVKDSSGAIVGVAKIARDITQRKTSEVEILKLNDELEEKVKLRTAQLEAANKELETFSYSVSHDLRAPLRHISGFSQLLVEEFGANLAPGARHYLDRIQAGTQNMGVLVDELLHLARVGRHALNRRTTNLKELVAEVITLLLPESEGRQVEWAVSDLSTAQCDPVLVRQIFQNLLSNALKFTRPRAQAVIEVSCREEGGQPVFMVRDNGIGFNMKYVNKLFGVFQRLHRAEDFEGTGIGLATVQRIVHKHGGQVWAEGEPSTSPSGWGNKLNRKTIEPRLEADYELRRTGHIVGGRQSG